MSFAEVSDLLLAAAALVLPAIVAWLGHRYTAGLKERDRRATYIQMALDILKQDPTPESRGLRRWAVDLINHYSEVPVPPSVRDDLETTSMHTLEVYRDFSRHLGTLDPQQRLAEQEHFTRLHMDDLRKALPGGLTEADLTLAAYKTGLQSLGYAAGPPDDRFTADFATAAESFQRDTGLEPADGIFGAMTVHALYRRLGRMD